MTKSTQKRGRVSVKQVSDPEIYTIDVLAEMVDEDLYARLRQLEGERSQAISSKFDPTMWEVELAYVQRELMIRNTRAQHHEKYLKQLDSEPSVSEDSLPYADLDNSSYTRLFN